jgi:c-di-GMP-binding flagellar brake protein YcgR
MTEMTEPEGRVYPRKPFSCAAKVAIAEKPPMDGSGVDISLGGICLTLPEFVDFGQYCVVKFDATANGVSNQFSALAKSVYCSRTEAGDFRVGFQFFRLDELNTILLHRIVDAAE